MEENKKQEKETKEKEIKQGNAQHGNAIKQENTKQNDITIGAMQENEILQIFQQQKEKYQKNPLISVKNRKIALKKLKNNIKEMNDEICRALKSDLNKSGTESYMTEIGLVCGEINFMLRHLSRFARKKRRYSPISNFPAKSFVQPSAYGVVLVISPWNYPFLLSMQPLVDAIAAGNRVILKPSEYSAKTTAVMTKLIKKTFESGYVDVVLGGAKECTFLLDQDFDYIFFTGSTRVGEIVMKKAAEHFTPVTLEMGGKSPCIIDQNTNLKLAAKRIIFGKLLNAGQTCVAPDYIYCHNSIKGDIVKLLISEIEKQYGKNQIANKNYPGMINKKQFDSMANLIDMGRVIYGGKSDEKLLKIQPTLLESDFDKEDMKKEIFGPILPILTFENIDEAIKNINKFTPNPLALYIFSNSHKNVQSVIDRCQFGGGCINDTIMHIANNHLSFGGVKKSGIGGYHGKKGFETFSHMKSIVKKSCHLDLPMRYQPFSKLKDKLIRMFLK